MFCITEDFNVVWQSVRKKMILFIVPTFLSATAAITAFTPMMLDTFGSVNGPLFTSIFFVVFVNVVCPPGSLGAFTIIAQVKLSRNSQCLGRGQVLLPGVNASFSAIAMIRVNAKVNRDSAIVLNLNLVLRLKLSLALVLVLVP